MRSSGLRKLKLFEMRIKTWNFRTTTYGVRSIAFPTTLSAHCALCKILCLFLNNAMFWWCFWEKNIEINVLSEVLQNAKRCEHFFLLGHGNRLPISPKPSTLKIFSFFDSTSLLWLRTLPWTGGRLQQGAGRWTQTPAFVLPPFFGCRINPIKLK